jgi:predicted dehydrogenase
MGKRIRVGLIGSQFISTIHAEALKQSADAELLAVASPTRGNARAFARKHGNAIETYSAVGYDCAVEKAGSAKGWSFTIYEEIWNYGFVHEMAHFVDCVKHDKQPLVTGEDGRAVLDVLFAAYASAGTGRKVQMPFKTDAAKPFDLWRGVSSTGS